MIYLKLFFTFMKIGLFTIGGGYAMLPMIQQEVLANGWTDSASLVNFIAVSESTPGPFAINIATYIGSKVGGVFGAVCTTVGVVLPSFVIILIIAKCYAAFQNSRIVRGCMSGLKPGVMGLIAASVISVAKTVFFSSGITTSVFSSPSFYVALVIFGLCCFFSFRRLHPILIICLSGVLGIAAGYLIL